MNKDQMPAGMPNVSLTEYSVPVRLLLTASGRFLMQTPGEIRAYHAGLIYALELELGIGTDECKAATKKQIDSRDKALAVYAKIEKEHAADIQQFVFRFRTAKGRDVAVAEAKAAIAPPAEGEAPSDAANVAVTLRPAYRLELARRTLIGHDWPGDLPQTDADFSDLDNDVREYVLGEVSKRTHFSEDVFSFLER